MKLQDTQMTVQRSAPEVYADNTTHIHSRIFLRHTTESLNIAANKRDFLHKQGSDYSSQE